ncbi:hypothetical protein CYLTODRAFT_473449 [Cylindrobasidium torrendii FP15055 ss-10]|uniref:F-box domain-containing protein n=1 Tax=Cylindrobasidium torrendii FP15055 ss-10 TaxID=1314674 RepID=A0A0D7B023_9AGAR|nr:hypothetical protein CYLTODRAFT_473449 [Cylindrobasidium torrendii FP15055 ss-10]
MSLADVDTTVSGEMELFTNPAQTSQAHTGIHTLPRELLAIVFEFYVLDTPADSWCYPLFQIGRLPPQFVLMKVCTFWWHFCVSLPALWRSITIDVRPKRDITPGSLVWNQFAGVCKTVLELSGSLPLEVELLSWYLNDESVQAVSGMGLDKRVFDNDELANRILQLVIAQCTRWKTFGLYGCAEEPDKCNIPWTQLTKVGHRIPLLQKIAFRNLEWLSPPIVPQPNYADILLDAPCLSFLAITSSSCSQYLNIPWSRLTTICIDISWPESYLQFADYFSFIMTQTTARRIMCYSSGELLKDTDGIRVTYPMTENAHVKALSLECLVLPPIRLPNLTSLNFCVGKRVAEDPFGVAQIELLLKNSRCHLQDLAIYDLAEDSDWQSIVRLCPYLNTLYSLRLYGQSPLNDQTAVTYVVEKLCDLFASPANLPNLTTLAFENIFSSPEEPQNIVHHCVFDARLAGAVWDIVKARMLGEWSEVQWLQKFHIQLNFPGVNAVMLDAQKYVESFAAQNIEEAGVNFKFVSNPMWSSLSVPSL